MLPTKYAIYSALFSKNVEFRFTHIARKKNILLCQCLIFYIYFWVDSIAKQT